VYYAKGDYENALVEYRKALEIQLKVLGPDHPDTATSYNNIGAVYDAKGDYEMLSLNSARPWRFN
jgi:tetratricopeptide (TPR) repeat protein